MTDDRIRCCIAECRRSFKRGPGDRWDREIICGRCSRTADARFMRRYQVLRARWRRIDRLMRRKSIALKAGAVRMHRAYALLERAIAANWSALKDDVQIKSRMRVEGTAGELAARRATQ